MTLETGVKELAEAVGADVKALEDGKVDSTDPRLTDSREWSEATVPQAEAEAGTASTRRAWTAQRVRQAINAWWQLVTSGFGRNFIAASNEQAARNALQLTYPATAPTVGGGAEVMLSGAYGIGEMGNPSIPIPSGLAYNAFLGGNMLVINSTGPYVSFLVLQENGALLASNKDGVAWNANIWHSGNQLELGATPATARTALELTGEWVDLRPYLKPGFYWDTAREGKNSHPRIRKLSCGRVELDGIVSFNETSGPTPVGVFVNIPAPFRPPFTCGGIMFADTGTPLAFGSCDWIVTGEVEYSPPRVHGDVMLIPLNLPETVQGGALSLNGIYWFT